MDDGMIKSKAFSMGSGITLFIVLVRWSSVVYGAVPIALILTSMFLYLLHLFFAYLLFIGTVAYRPAYLRPWLWLRGIETVLLTLVLVALIIACLFYVQVAMFAPMSLLLGVGICMVWKYCCQVVYALILQIESGSMELNPRTNLRSSDSSMLT